MNKNVFIKILGSLPIILVALYFSRFLGIILILLRYISYKEKKRDITPIVLVIAGLVVFIPEILNALFDLIKFNTKNIPYFNDIVDAKLYTTNFMRYGRALIIIGVVFAIIGYILTRVSKEFKKFVKSNVDNYTNKQIQYEKENDLKIKEQQEKAKNTQVVVCKKCGASNIITSNIGKCKYCRNTIIGK